MWMNVTQLTFEYGNNSYRMLQAKKKVKESYLKAYLNKIRIIIDYDRH
jgi:hypothetical protein